LAIYAWDSAPIDATDIPHSFIAFGRNFSFPLDYNSKPLEDFAQPFSQADKSVKFLTNTCHIVQNCGKILALLNQERCEYYNELVNIHRKQITFNIGDIVLTHHQVHSRTDKSIVTKLSYDCTGPYKVISKSDSGNYTLQALHNEKIKIQKHGKYLIIAPPSLHPYPSVVTTDGQFMNIHHQSIDSPFYSTFRCHSDILDNHQPNPSIPFTPVKNLDCNLFPPRTP